MSVIPESLEGDELVCLGEFVTSPHGEPFSWETSRRFRVGERVKFAGWYEDKQRPDNPVCWMVLFDAADGKRYAATQTFFVTGEGWQRLAEHFARKRQNRAGRKPKSVGTKRTPEKKQRLTTASRKRRIA